MTETALYTILAALFGLLIGSFLNVCIYRWIRYLSVVTPRSACPECSHQIAWYDNIPVLSYLLLKAKCRHCKTSIPWTYPAVEILTAVSFAWFVGIEGPTLPAAKDCVFAAIMIGLIFSDLDSRLLPDEFTIGGLIAGLVFALFIPLPPTIFAIVSALTGMHLALRVASLGEAIAGAAIPAGAMWALGWIFEKVRKREHLGLGDVKMIAMMGAFLGIGDCIVALMLGSLCGSILGYPILKLTGRDPSTYPLPFASILGAAALVIVVAHGGITGWYQQLLR